MNVKIFEFNPIAVNTYVLYDETGECVIVDAACFFPNEQQELLNFINEKKLDVKHLINTHLHFDHVFGINFIEKQFDVKMQAHKADEFLLANMEQQMAMFGFPANGDYIPTLSKYIDENDTIEFGNQKLSIISVPGHSPGSIVFYNEEKGIAVSGDVLFNGSIGRTDLPQGNHNLLIDGIKTKMLTMPVNTVVYPGHGPDTSIEKETKTNPFLQ
ncbi:MAG: MBL fold metallo-hydrolase [Bacteroidales bacterium]|nr:MBL fold metallo-hydrolase [Bacteroidales bacterium]